ncbi:MAG: hypothetical protein KDE24_13115, partial [Caldilinea sp.]|nr:hypothetical protein [Caldilinea sp.]
MRAMISWYSSSIFCRSRAAKTAQLHVEDRLRLYLRQPEAFHERGAGGLGALALADGANDLVQVFQRDAQPFQDVGALACLGELVFRAARQHLEAMVDIDHKRAAQAERHRLAVDQRQRVDAKGGLQLCVLEEAIARLFWCGVALQFNDDAHARAVGFVAQVADHVQLVLAHQFGDALDERGLVHLVRDFRDDDGKAPVAHLLDGGPGAHEHLAAPRGKGLPDALGAKDDAARREVGTLDELHEFFQADVVAPLPVVDD